MAHGGCLSLWGIHGGPRQVVQGTSRSVRLKGEVLAQHMAKKKWGLFNKLCPKAAPKDHPAASC